MKPYTSNWQKQFQQSYATLPTGYYQYALPQVTEAPQTVVYNRVLADLLEIEGEPSASELMGEGFEQSIALAYGGHQFGHFTMLGDGRAHLLGEKTAKDGLRYDLQLKGSGRTPYSRGGDGLAGLGPMLREYLMSEAMAALGIPTTRSLSVVLTGRQIVREKTLPGAVLGRVAKGHLRVGSLQLAAAREDLIGLSALADYAIDRFYPNLKGSETPYLDLFKAICQGQADLIAQWQLIGFVHGVLNTDNVSLTCETIDYGPCAFLDAYHPQQVFSSIDTQGRYAFGNQPSIGAWNLARLADALMPLVAREVPNAQDALESALNAYFERHLSSWREGFKQKLGIEASVTVADQLFLDLLSLMDAHDLDFTNTFIDLETHLKISGGKVSQAFELGEPWLCVMDAPASVWLPWLEQWQLQLGDQEAALQRMAGANPKVIPRNHRLDEALKAAENGDMTAFHQLLEVVLKPFSQPLEIAYQMPNPSKKPHKTFCGT